MKSRGSQCSETLLVRAAVRPGKKLGLQSAANNLQWRRCLYWLRQTVPNRCSSRPPGRFGRQWGHDSAWSDQPCGFSFLLSSFIFVNISQSGIPQNPLISAAMHVHCINCYSSRLIICFRCYFFFFQPFQSQCSQVKRSSLNVMQLQSIVFHVCMENSRWNSLFVFV